MASTAEIASRAVEDLNRFVRLLSAYEASRSVAESKAAYGESPDEEIEDARDWSADPPKAWNELQELGNKLGPQLEHRSSQAAKAMVWELAAWRRYRADELWSPSESTESFADPDRLVDIHTAAWDLRWLLAIARSEADFFLYEAREIAGRWSGNSEPEVDHPIHEVCRLLDAVGQAGFSVSVGQPPHDERTLGLALYRNGRSRERFGHLMPTYDMAAGSGVITAAHRWFHDALAVVEAVLTTEVSGDAEALPPAAEVAEAAKLISTGPVSQRISLPTGLVETFSHARGVVLRLRQFSEKHGYLGPQSYDFAKEELDWLKEALAKLAPVAETLPPSIRVELDSVVAIVNDALCNIGYADVCEAFLRSDIEEIATRGWREVIRLSKGPAVIWPNGEVPSQPLVSLPEPAAQPPADPVNPDSDKPLAKVKGQNISGRMHTALSNAKSDPDKFAGLLERTQRQWAAALECSPGTVGGTAAWKDILVMRATQRAARVNSD